MHHPRKLPRQEKKVNCHVALRRQEQVENIVVCILGIHSKIFAMLADIEEVVTNELSGLCESCIHAVDCAYRKNAQKVVIQCEVFESIGEAEGGGQLISSTPLKGLCLNCNKNHFCNLPKEASGVWHCEEYE